MNADPEITGKLEFSASDWSEALQRYVVLSAKLVGGNIIGATHEFLADADESLLVKTPDGYRIDGYALRYLKESEFIPKCSLFEVTRKY